MSFDIGNVMFALHRHFPNPLPSNPSISRHEQKVADHLASIIKESYYGDTSVEESEYLVQEEYGDWEPEVFEPYDCVLPDQDDEHFRPFLQHCWKKAGYVGAANTSSTPFLTPAQYCIDHGDTVICYHTGCNHLGFIRCARCKMFVCFNHFVVSKQHLCSSP